MSFTAVILKLPFSALSTVRWGKGRKMLQERVNGRCQSTPVFCPLRTYAHRSGSGQRARSPSKPFPGASGEEVLICRHVKVLHVTRDGRPGAGVGRLQLWWRSGPLWVKFHNCFLPTASHTCWKRTWL